ncbi:MAG TPA: flavodoxin [Bacillota bacterium]|nr:flavodoxin [Bacillota bacterium]
MKVLIAYLTYSGNTQEVAELIAEQLADNDIDITWHRIGFDLVPDVDTFDVIFLGTFTWDYGETPFEVKEFVLDVGYKPENIAIFGTGDTQFGDANQYCKAVDKLVTFYESPWPGLKIEQSPRGSQEHLVKKWVGGVMQYATNITYAR